MNIMNKRGISTVQVGFHVHWTAGGSLYTLLNVWSLLNQNPNVPMCVHFV